MDRITRVEQYLSLMIFIIRADGIVDDDETSQLFRLLGERLETPPEDAVIREILTRLGAEGSRTPTDEQLLAAGSGMDTLTLCHLVRDAYALAASDGEIHADEVKTMRRYLRLAGIPVERFADIDLWARGAENQFALGETLLALPPRP